MERSEPAVLQAESLRCYSLGWSAQRAAPGPLTQNSPALKGRYPQQPSRVTAFQALE